MYQVGFHCIRRYSHFNQTFFYRDMWNRILAVYLFIYHCTLEVGSNATESSINRLFAVSFAYNPLEYFPISVASIAAWRMSRFYIS